MREIWLRENLRVISDRPCWFGNYNWELKAKPPKSNAVSNTKSYIDSERELPKKF